jgi:hypothetical protein
LEVLTSFEAGSGLLLAALNCRYLLGYFRQVISQARRVGCLALALVNGALVLEAGLFLSANVLTDWSATAQGVAVVMVRSVLLLSAAAISLLIWRVTWRRRR